MKMGYSRVAIVGALVAILAFATAAILFASGDDAMQRLALLFGLFGVVVPSLVSSLKADKAETATNAVSSIAQALNGGFEARVRHANRQTAKEIPGALTTIHNAEADAVTAAKLSGDMAAPPDPPITASKTQ